VWWCGLACGRVVLPAASRFGDGCDVVVVVVAALVKEVLVAVGSLPPRHGLVVAACGGGGVVVVVDSVVWSRCGLCGRCNHVTVWWWLGGGCSLPVVSPLV